MQGGDDGNDLTEINVLNHYIGMAELQKEDFTEFQWIPLIIGLMIVLSLRAAAIGALSIACGYICIYDLLCRLFNVEILEYA